MIRCRSNLARSRRQAFVSRHFENETILGCMKFPESRNAAKIGQSYEPHFLAASDAKRVRSNQIKSVTKSCDCSRRGSDILMILRTR